MSEAKPAGNQPYSAEDIIATLNSVEFQQGMAENPDAQKRAAETAARINGTPNAQEQAPGNDVALRGSSVAVQTGNAVAVRGSSAVEVREQPSNAVARRGNVIEGELVDMGVAERNAADHARRNGHKADTPDIQLPAEGWELWDQDGKPKDNADFEFKTYGDLDPDLFSPDQDDQDKGKLPVQYDKDGNPIYTNIDLSKKGNKANTETADDGGEGGDIPLDTLEKLKKHGIKVDKWAKAKKAYEDKVGFLKFNNKAKQEAALKEAREEVAKEIADLEGVDANTKMELWGDAINAVGKRQEQMSEETKWYNKKAARVALVVGLGLGLGVAAAATGGIAALGLPAALAAAVKGGLVGTATGLTAARLSRSAANTKAQTEARVSNQLNQVNLGQAQGEDYDAYSGRTGEALHGQSQEHRASNEKMRRKYGIRGAVGGAVLGFLLGGLTADGGPADAPKEPIADAKIPEAKVDLPVPSKETIAQMVIDDPSKINSVPGLDGLTIESADPTEAANEYNGKYVWDSLENGSGITKDAETFKAFMEGWDKLHDVPGVQVDTWGDVQFNETSGTYETTGDRWGANITADNLRVVNADGTITGPFDGQLTTAQHAELLDASRQEGAQFLSGDDQYREFLESKITATPEQMTQMVNNTVDQIVKEVNSEWAAQQAEVGPQAPEDLQQLRQGIIQQNISQHAALITSLPEAYRDTLITQIAQANSISEAAIREMLQKSLTLAA